MSEQATQVFKLADRDGRSLSAALTRAGYLFRSVPHARFQAQGEGVTVTLYTSGKLVLQGRGLDMWTARFLPGVKSEPAPARKAGALPPPAEAAAGSDEAGKGDTFGPLVVCALALPAGADEVVRAWSVTDSKQMSDQKMAVLAPQLRERFEHEERILEPPEYNARYAAGGANLNHLLSALHEEVLEALLERTGIGVAVVDSFSASKPVTRHLHKRNPALVVHEVPRAERHPAVAAASVLARTAFLESMQRLEQEWAVDLPRGSGAPIPPALRRFLEIHGPSKVEQVAKLHFRTVARALQDNSGG